MDSKKFAFSMSDGLDTYKVPDFTQDSNKKWVNYGSDNMYPYYLVDLFNRSAKHNAILTGKNTYIYGQGLKLEGEPSQLFNKPNRFESLSEIYNKLILDKLLYGGYALQIIWDMAGQGIAEIYHMDFSKLRSNIDNTSFFYSANWGDNKHKPKEYKAYNPEKREGTQIYYYRDYRPAIKTYPLPEYIGAIPYVECDIQIANYHRSNLHNNFFFGGILSFNNGEPTQEEKDTLVRMINRRHQDTDNAGRWIINFSDGADKAPTVNTLEPSALDKQFEILNAQVQQEIFVAHKITSPMFFGIKTEGQLGGRSEMIDSFKLFEQNYITPIQQHFEELFNYLFGISGIQSIITIEPLQMFKPSFSEQTLLEIATKEEMREMAGLEATIGVESAGSRTASKIGLFSPLVANKILDTLTQDEVRALAGIEPTTEPIEPAGMPAPTQMASEEWKREIEVFAEFGEDANLFEEIESKKVSFNTDQYSFESQLEFDEQELMQFASVYEPTPIDNKVIDLVKKNPTWSKTKIASELKIGPTELNTIFDKLNKEGILKLTDGIWNILKLPPPISAISRIGNELAKYSVKYKYTGPSDSKNRDFCRAMLNLNKVYTRDDIDKISNRVDRNVWTKRGGWQTIKGTDIHLPFCRHTWSSVLVKKK
jgi:DNA-binding Lrp family transcriptional regulator